MSDEPTHTRDSLAPLLAAFDEGLAVGREPELAVPPELADDFAAARSVLRLLNVAWPRPNPADTTVDQSSPPAAPRQVPHAELVRLGRFKVLRELGQGGFGVVYLAYDPTLARHVALKAPRSDRWGAPEFRRRFLQEGRAAALLDHPNIVRVLEADATESAGYIASVFCEGPNLGVWLRERKEPPSCRLAAALTADLAAGIHHAHERGVVHRDLKPANVLLEIGSEMDASDQPRRITPKICDFGLAKVLEGEQTETRPGAVMGTAQYMAPEQAEGRTAEVGPAADVYALGVVLYEMLTGRPPFVGEPGLDLLRRVVSAPPERPSRRRKDVPRDLETIVLTCLEKEPGRRYGSAAALETDLRRWLDGKPPLGRPEPWRRRVGRWVRRHPVMTAAAALALLVAVAGVIAWPYLNPDPDRVPKEAAARLSSRQAVPLIRDKGGPDWCRWLTGGEAAKLDVSPDGVFNVHTWDLSLLELLPDPGRDSYRLQAEVRHDNNEYFGQVGLFFAHRVYPTVRGDVHSFLQLTFDDVHSAAEKIPPNFFDRLPPALRAQVSVPTDNQVWLLPRYWSSPNAGADWDRPCAGRNPELFRPAGMHNNHWRKLVVEVTPQEVRGFWEDRTPIGAPLSTSEIMESTMRALEETRAERPNDPTTGAVGPGFAPRGGLGLFLQKSSASFRNVVVEPLD